MTRSVRWKLAAAFLGIATLPVIGLGLYLGGVMRQGCHAQIEESLRRSAVLIARQAHAVFAEGLSERSEALARELSRASAARVTLIARDGTVLGDSEHDPRAMENHRDRPEVQEALASGIGLSTRHSDTLGVDMLYVAARVGTAEQPLGTARVALPLTQVQEVEWHASAAVMAAVALAVVLAGLLSVWVSGRVTGPLRELSEAANAVAAGNLEARVRVRTGDELGQVVETFNAMVAELRRTVEGLEEEKRRAETLLAQMAEGVIVVGAEGRVTMCNAAAAAIFGVASEAAVGRTLAEATLHYELDEMLTRVRRHGVPVRMDIRVTQPREAALDAVVTPIFAEDGHLEATVCVFHDTTELQRLETVRRDFVANVSHELRTPVTAIRATADVLLGTARDDPQARDRFLRNIAAECERLSALLDDLLALARIESGKWEPRLQPVSVREAAEAVVAKVQPQIAEKHLEVSVTVAPEVQAQADPDALQQILLNLVDNAVKYTPAGGRIAIEGGMEDGRARFDVVDTGVGIPERDLPRIFERFYRVDRARSRELGGTGLGLSIVKHLVEAHGGQVTAESTVEQGSRFTVRLPAAAGMSA